MEYEVLIPDLICYYKRNLQVNEEFKIYIKKMAGKSQPYADQGLPR